MLYRGTGDRAFSECREPLRPPSGNTNRNKTSEPLTPTGSEASIAHTRELGPDVRGSGPEWGFSREPTEGYRAQLGT